MTYPCDHAQLDIDKPFTFGGFDAYIRNKAGFIQALRDKNPAIKHKIRS